MPIYYNENTPALANANLQSLQQSEADKESSILPLTKQTCMTKAVYLQTKAADAAASTATSEHVLLSSTLGLTLTKITYVPDAALTANDTNFATLLISSRNAAGGGQVTIASIQTTTSGTGSWTAFLGVDFGSLANNVLTTGMSVTLTISKSGTGVVVPGGSFVIEGVLT
jgi:hypothetical protein